MAVDLENLTGTHFQGWLLKERLGRGADGIVYAGEKDGRSAAVKIFSPESLHRHGWALSQDRLDLQLTLLGKKHHDHLVEIYAGGEDPTLKTLFLIMEYVPGKSLDKILGSVPATAIPVLAQQLAAAARYLQQMGLVHRDIKPANIVISDDFQKLTLLDFGVVHQLPSECDDDRLSGLEFVATLRYSPPEFVWRTEQGNEDEAWRAVTFYQIGATLHDMIMGKVLFAGHDTPRAHLYDAVRDRTPVVQAESCPDWLVQTVRACLLKDWRQRLQLVAWDAFSEPSASNDVELQEKRIRLHQVTNEEKRQAQTRQISTAPARTREQELWHLHNALFMEIRTYLIGAAIFPKGSVSETPIGSQIYETRAAFERDPALGFVSTLAFKVQLGIDAILAEATKMTFEAHVDGQIVATATWTEMFTVNSAFSLCRKSFLDAVDSMFKRSREDG